MFTKRCSKCGIEKPISEFYANRSRADGLCLYCKACEAEDSRHHYQEHGDKAREYARRYRQEHPDKKREYARRYAQQHPDKMRERKRRYRQEHPDKGRAHKQTRRARKCAAPGSYTDTDLQRQYKAQHGLCFWCSDGLTAGWHVDHVIPLSRGGSNWPANLVCACQRCNQSKGDKLPWLEWQPPKPLQAWHPALDDLKGDKC